MKLAFVLALMIIFAIPAFAQDTEAGAPDPGAGALRRRR